MSISVSEDVDGIELIVSFHFIMVDGLLLIAAFAFFGFITFIASSNQWPHYLSVGDLVSCPWRSDKSFSKRSPSAKFSTMNL